MPEGPEIRRSADQIAAALEGQTLQAVEFGMERLKPFEKLLTGQQVESVSSRGKAMLIRFANQLTLYSHNQLYGVWVVRRAGSLPVSNRQLRVSLRGPQKWALLYSATDIALLDPDELAQHPYLCRLGPDMLDEEVRLQDVLARYQDKAFARKRLTTLLLDQHFLAGMGNYLRSEILHVARIPATYRPLDCSPAQLQALAEASLELPRRSRSTGGITNDLERVAQLKAAGLSRSRYRFWVFARDNKPCYRCETLIVRSEVGGRRLYTCPRCQAAP